MVRKISLSLFAVVLAVVVAGCATGPKGPSDQELVQQAVQNFTSAAVAKDVNKMMSVVSEKFSADQWPDKDAYKAYVGEAIDMGYLDDAKIAVDKAKTTIENGKAKVYPIEVETASGSATVELVLSKEAAAWLITDMNLEMY